MKQTCCEAYMCIHYYWFNEIGSRWLIRAPSTPSILKFSNFQSEWWIMYVQTDGKQPENYEFLHFCHIDMPYGFSWYPLISSYSSGKLPCPLHPKASLNFLNFWSGWWIMMGQMGINQVFMIFYTFVTMKRPKICSCHP